MLFILGRYFIFSKWQHPRIILGELNKQAKIPQRLLRSVLGLLSCTKVDKLA